MMNSDPDTTFESWLAHRRNQESPPRPGGDAFTTSVMQALPESPPRPLGQQPRSQLWQRLPRPITNGICLIAGLTKVTLILHFIS